MSANRQPWADYFFDICNQVAQRSTCCRRKVGAVIITKEKRIIGTGYNGAPPGLEHCTQNTCIRHLNKIPSGQKLEMCKAVHAEVNAVLATSSRMDDMFAIFITNQPCTSCIKLLMSTNIVLIAWDNRYDDKYSQELMKEWGYLFTYFGDTRRYLVRNDYCRMGLEGYHHSEILVDLVSKK